MSRKTYSKKFLNIDLLTAPAVFKAPKSCSVATAFFLHVLRTAGASEFRYQSAKTQLIAKHEINSTKQTQASPDVVNLKWLTHVKDCKGNEHAECDDFLGNFELPQ